MFSSSKLTCVGGEQLIENKNPSEEKHSRGNTIRDATGQ